MTGWKFLKSFISCSMHHGGTFHQRDSLAQKCYICQHFCVKKGLLKFFWPGESFLKVSFHYLYIIRQHSTKGIAWRKNVKNVNIFHLVRSFFWKFDRVRFYKKWVSYIASLRGSIPISQTFRRKNVYIADVRGWTNVFFFFVFVRF